MVGIMRSGSRGDFTTTLDRLENGWYRVSITRNYSELFREATTTIYEAVQWLWQGALFAADKTVARQPVVQVVSRNAHTVFAAITAAIARADKCGQARWRAHTAGNWPISMTIYAVVGAPTWRVSDQVFNNLAKSRSLVERSIIWRS